MDPPVPIPNTVVKHSQADGTWLETTWESRMLPVKRKALLDGSAFSFGVYVLLGNGRKHLAGGEYAGGIFSGNIQTEYLDISATGRRSASSAQLRPKVLFCRTLSHTAY